MSENEENYRNRRSNIKSELDYQPYYNPTGEEIWLHLDTPIASSPHTLMGGGEEVPHSDGDTITYDRRGGERNDYGDYYDAYFNADREDLFHYSLMADRVKSDGDYVGGVANGDYGGHFTVADGEWRELEAGSCFMHELGHTLGLHSWDFDGVDSEKYSFAEYPSVMNYNAPDDYFDYSNGPDSGTNNNDWSELKNDMGDYL